MALKSGFEMGFAPSTGSWGKTRLESKICNKNIQHTNLNPHFIHDTIKLSGQNGSQGEAKLGDCSPSISNSYTTPLFFKMAQNLDLRCVLISDPGTSWVLGPKHVSNPE